VFIRRAPGQRVAKRLAAAAVVAVAVAISSSGAAHKGIVKGAKANATVASVRTLLAGIPQAAPLRRRPW
jgi:hypothetical protein